LPDFAMGPATYSIIIEILLFRRFTAPNRSFYENKFITEMKNHVIPAATTTRQFSSAAFEPGPIFRESAGI
jgi:hypothetical protein